MDLTLNLQTANFSLDANSPTVVSPGQNIEIQLSFHAQTQIELAELEWKTPQSLVKEPLPIVLPATIAQSDTLVMTQVFRTGSLEDFGEIEATLKYRAGSSPDINTLEWRHWISIFRLVTEDDPSGLSMPSRQKLVDVVNARLINGFLYMSDFLKFFDHYLNIEIPGPLAARISNELSLTQEELPVDGKMFIRIAKGEINIYGIEEFELIPEEQCEESDDKFDADDLMEVIHPDIDI